MKKLERPINVTKPFLPPIEEYKEKINQIWDTNFITNNGPLHKELEDKLRKYLKIDNIALFTNGHLALDIAIKSLGITGEVITTPFTFASTTHAIVSNNLTPVFCDINMKDFTIDADKIESLVNENTSAIIPVHVFGQPCNISAIDAIAKKYNLKVIYDAAHTFGVEVEGIGIGNFGDVSMFSLHATKVYNSIEGGLLSCNNKDLIDRFNKYKNFGITGPESVDYVGINAKMNEFQAAMGLVNLNHIDKQIANRKIIAEIYRRELSQVNGIYYLDDKPNVKSNYSYFPILIDEEITKITRNEMYIKLAEYNVFTRKYFYPLVTDFNCYKDIYNSDNLKNAEYVADRVLTLPLYGELSEIDALKITQLIKFIIKNKFTK